MKGYVSQTRLMDVEKQNKRKENKTKHETIHNINK